jgi:hypothetical protein
MPGSCFVYSYPDGSVLYTLVELMYAPTQSFVLTDLLPLRDGVLRYELTAAFLHQLQ